MILHWWQSSLFLLISSQNIVFNKKANIGNWQGCLKRRPREANTFHVYNLKLSRRLTRLLAREYFIPHFIYFPWPPLEAGLSTSTFCFLLPRYESLTSERNYPASRISKYNFLCLLSLRCCNYLWLNILLFLCQKFFARVQQFILTN